MPPAANGPPRDPATTANAGSNSGTALQKKAAMANAVARAPPLEVVEMGFYPLSMIIGRLVQHSWNQLNEMIESLQAPGLSDGDKKHIIVKYALDMRKQFIKALVITMWAKNAGSVHQVINLNNAIHRRIRAHDLMTERLKAIRRQMGGARVPNPDLNTALEVLSTGEPRLEIMKQYVPPPKMSPQDILKILRHINAFLSIRIGLHETLPDHFRDYRIASGRATFSVPDEFEVDLSIGDENLQSQLYVIDVRPAFEPAVKPLPQTIFTELEARGNQVLGRKDKPLEGIYEFLHDYFMVLKILALQKQAYEMLQGRWTQSLKIQLIKKTLVIQYWTHRQGERSWIEVGVKRGVGGKPSKLGVRWIREGKIVTDVEIQTDFSSLSAEALMRAVIAKHIAYTLTNIKQKLSDLFGAGGRNALALEIDESNPIQSHLHIQLTPSRECRLLIEPVTGWFAIQKPSPLATNAENQMNQHPLKTSEILFRFRLGVAADEIESRAQSMGWEILKTLNLKQHELKQHFPPSTRNFICMRRNGWSKNWMVTVILEEYSNSWWIAEVVERPQYWSITTVFKIPMKGEATADYTLFTELEKMSAGMITYFVNSRELATRGIQYTFRPSESYTRHSSSVVRVPDLYIRFSSLLPDATWALDSLKICYQGLSTKTGSCILFIVGRTKVPMTQLGKTPLSDPANSDVSFHAPSGSFLIRFDTPIASNIISTVINKLTSINRLIDFVTTIRAFHLNPTHVSLQTISFRYASHTATVSLAAPKLSLSLSPESPHIRMLPFLRAALSSPGAGLRSVIKSLLITLPLLNAFNDIEKDHPNSQEPIILVRSLEWFRMEFPGKLHALDIRTREKRGKVYWYMMDPAPNGSGQTLLPHQMNTTTPERKPCVSVKKVWAESGDGWEGLNNGAVAEVRAVGELVRRVVEVVMASSR